MNNYKKKIISHYETVFKNQANILKWDKGPVNTFSNDFCILEFSPNQSRDMWTYATCCMSEENEFSRIELHIFSKKQDRSIIELLYATAYYHKQFKLNLNHTINFGRPWQNESECKFGFISLPYLDGANLENLKQNNRFIKFYWLIPITLRELEIKKNRGVNALEELFEQEGFDYSNSKRKSLA